MSKVFTYKVCFSVEYCTGRVKTFDLEINKLNNELFKKKFCSFVSFFFVVDIGTYWVVGQRRWEQRGKRKI